MTKNEYVAEFMDSIYGKDIVKCPKATAREAWGFLASRMRAVGSRMTPVGVRYPNGKLLPWHVDIPDGTWPELEDIDKVTCEALNIMTEINHMNAPPDMKQGLKLALLESTHETLGRIEYDL